MNKIKGILTFVVLFISMTAMSQVFLINEMGTGQDAEQACTGTIYDSGGATGNYSSNESYTATICSDNGSTVELSFTQFVTQEGYDMLTITDGPNDAAPIIAGPVSGTALQGQTIVSTGNCLTLIWSSSGTGNMAGWAATINCGMLCQGYTIDMVSTVPAITNVDSMWIDICPGDDIDFNVNGVFPNNGSQGYSQSNSTVDFHWFVVNGDQDTTEVNGLGMTNFNHVFNEPGGYFVVVQGVDQNGCYNMNYLEYRVRVSIPPYFNGTNIQPDPVCPGAEIALDGEIQANDWHAPIPEISAGVTFLPDGNGASYTTCLNYTIFNPGQTIQNASDILDIMINMEHSYLGDLNISIQCPNGSQTVLKPYPGGGGTYLGEPIDNDSDLTPGVGYEYFFTENSPTYGTMLDEAGGVSTLPAGSYTPEESFANLIGCPLNGEWCIVITDNLSIDNGYIFQWGMNFNPDVYPDDFWIIANNFPSSNMTWDGPNMGDQSVGNGLAYPMVSGDAVAYTFTAIDDFGCAYDTTVTVTVLPQDDPTCCVEPTPTIGGDQVICTNSFALTASSPVPGNNGFWEQVSGPGTATFTDNTDPNAIVTVPIFGDYEFQWSELYLGNESCMTSVSINISFNEMLDPTIAPIADMCLSANPVELVIEDIGTLSCPSCPPGVLDDGIIHPENDLGPGSYTITNTVSGPCTTTPSSQVSFEIFDELHLVGFNDQECISGSNPEYITEWTVAGSDNTPTSDYEVNGVLQSSPDFYEQHPSATGYSYTITDLNGCTNITVAGIRDCDCPSAGTMASLETVVLCQGECTGTAVFHNNDNTVIGASVFEFMIHDGDNVPIAYSSDENFCLNDFGGAYNTVYYISGVTGYDNNGDGHPDLTGACFAISQGTPVMWMLNPIPNAGIDKDTCGQVMQLDGNNVPDGMIGYWSSSCDFVAVGGTDNHDPNMMALSGEFGQCTFTWTLVNGQCIGTDDVEITFNQTPEAYAGADTITCGTSIDLQVENSLPGTTFSWSGSGMNFNPSSGAITTASVSAPGTYVATVTEYNGSCYDQDERVITFIPGPQPTVVNSIDTTCGVDYCLEVNNVEGTGVWTAFNDGVQIYPVFEDDTDPFTCVTIANYTGATHDIEFVWTETNSFQGVLCSNSVSIDVTFAKVPLASADVDWDINGTTICGNEVALEANLTGSEFTDGTWIIKDIIGEFSNPHDANTLLTINPLGAFDDSHTVEVPILWTITNANCSSVDTVEVTFYDQPQANAGVNDSICGLQYELGAVYDLIDTDVYDPNGEWSNLATNPGSVNISVPTSDTTLVNVGTEGLYGFVWRERHDANPGCYTTDTVWITFKEIPIIDAGDDFDVCGQTTALEGVSAGFEGAWQPVPGVAYVDYQNPESQVDYASYGAVDFIWTENNDECTSKDTVTVTFWRKPIAQELVADDDTTVCGLIFDRLRAEEPADGVTGNWIAEPGSGVTFYTQTYDETVEVNDYGYFDFYWILSTGPDNAEPDFCTDTADAVNVHFIEVPDAFAGTDTIFCGYSGTLNAELYVPETSTGSWTNLSEENIIFDDNTDPTSGVTSNVLTADNPTYDNFELVWTENNMSCTNSDTVVVGFARIPVADMVIIPPRCEGEPASIKAKEDSLATYAWTWNGGVIDSVWPANAEGGEFRFLTYWPNDDTAHYVDLVVENHWGCQSFVNKDTVYEPYRPQFEVVTYPDTCALGKGAFEFTPDPTSENPSFRWIDTLGVSYPVPVGDTITDLPEGTYNGIHLYRTYNTAWVTDYLELFGTEQCTDTFDINIETAGLIDANFEIDVTTDMDALVAPNAEVRFLNLTDNDNMTVSCTWYFGDGETENSCDDQISHIYTEANDCYEPFLVVKARYLPECRDTAFLDCIKIDDMSKLEIPNIFTPNGDGMNDYFQVKAQTLQSFHGVIVNRWGREIFEWTDPEQGWDGKMSGGAEAAPGVYYYIIKATGMDGVTYEETGPLHLVREK
jgi:gliding motility-associated-like protein